MNYYLHREMSVISHLEYAVLKMNFSVSLCNPRGEELEHGQHSRSPHVIHLLDPLLQHN